MTKNETTPETTKLEELEQALAKKERRIVELEQRLTRLEKRIKSNERFAHTLSDSLSTQVVAIDAVTQVISRALHTNADIQKELMSAIHEYDQHKFRRWLSGFCSIVLWISSIAAAVCTGAFVYWLFSGK